MTLTELKTQLDTSKLPVAYLSFPADEAPAMPFVVYQEIMTNNFGADGVVYKKISRIQIDLFTYGRDIAAEEALEDALSFTFWNKEQTPIDDEACYRWTYEIEINNTTEE